MMDPLVGGTNVVTKRTPQVSTTNTGYRRVTDAGLDVGGSKGRWEKAHVNGKLGDYQVNGSYSKLKKKEADLRIVHQKPRCEVAPQCFTRVHEGPCYRAPVSPCHQRERSPCYRPPVCQEKKVSPCYRPQVRSPCHQRERSPCYRPPVCQEKKVSPCYRPQVRSPVQRRVCSPCLRREPCIREVPCYEGQSSQRPYVAQGGNWDGVMNSLRSPRYSNAYDGMVNNGLGEVVEMGGRSLGWLN